MTALAAPRRTARWSLNESALAKIVAGLVILAVWEIGCRLFAPAYVAKPIGILLAIPDTVTSVKFLDAAWSTIWAVIRGLILALIVGTAVGLSMGRVPTVERALRYYVSGMYAMPMVAVLPLVTLWFGYTNAARMATIVFAAFFAIAINAADGARAVPPEYIEVARAFRARWKNIWLGIAVPASLPYLLAGVRLAAGRALIGCIVAEFFISLEGLGFYILFNSRTFNHNAALVAVLVLAAFGVGVETLINWATKRYLPWYRRGERGE